MLELHSFHRIWCLAKFELVRMFLTKRGAIAIAAFAMAWFFILYYAVSRADELVSSDLFVTIAHQVVSSAGIQALLSWPVPELSMFWVMAIYSFPLFSLIASSDQTCADRTRGTLRFIALRATRTEILIGRFSGQVLILMVLIASTLFATLLMASYREASLFFVGLMKSLSLFQNILIAVMPFIALMSFFNSFIRSSRLAIIVSFLFFGLTPLVISFIEYKLGLNTYLNYLIPGVQLSDVINQKNALLSGYFIPLAQTCGYLLVGNIIMKRSSL
ncbi:MAG: ABC transporter permease [Colwellia sp.]|nr:ABC transporter permease [Colwellia sp.]MCW9080501.1 ABC transporter permease [Colwellia sp.]